MNIAWIEDDISYIKQGVKLYVELLDLKNNTQLIKEKEFKGFYNPHQEFTHPESLKEWFEKNSLSSLNWFETYASMKKRIDDLAKRCVEEWDVVIIDLNLVNHFDPKESAVDPTKAGFALYVQLLRFGFPAANIAFFTANTGEMGELDKIAKGHGIPTPERFSKDKDDQLKAWLDKHLDNNELTLRRGILDGCTYMADLLREDPNKKLRINDFACDEDGYIGAETAIDWLKIWPKLLPDVENSEEKRYAPFMLALLSLWDMKSKSIDTHSDNSPFAQLDKSDKNRGFNVIPFILTHARNWIAHGQALHDVSTQGAAFVFLLAGRGLIKRQPQTDRYERILLALFPKFDGGIDNVQSQLRTKKELLLNAALPLVEQALQNTRGNYAALTKVKAGIEKKNIYFNSLANAYIKNLSSQNKPQFIPFELLMLALLSDLTSWTNEDDWLESVCYSIIAHLELNKKSNAIN